MDNNPAERQTKLQAYLLLGLLAVIWGTSFILIKRGLEHFTPVEVGLTRIGVAAFALMPVAVFHLRKVKPNQWWKFLASGILGNLVPAILFSFAGSKLNSAVSGALNGLTPLFTLLVGLAFYKSQIKWVHWAGIGLGLVGAIVFAARKSGIEGVIDINGYALFAVIATVCYAFNVYLLKFWLGNYKPIVISSLAIFFSGFPGAFWLFSNEHWVNTAFYNPLAQEAVLGLCILGIIGTAITLICFNYLVQITSPLFASSVTYLIPVVAMLWGVFDKEALGISHLLGVTFIISGVLIINRKKA
jgi:drug/metabolite transporter (DMT)-like permease